MRKPNFFLIGAPKCGTTSFQEYLTTHPSIFMSTPKELCYFDSDLPYPNSPKNENEYMDFFKNVTNNHSIIGEASVGYLYSRVAVTNILSFNPEARFMVMIRNPIDMARSMHAYSVQVLEENIEDFKEAWRLQEKRELGFYLPPTCYHRDFVLYGKLRKLGEQLQRLFHMVPREKVHVIIFDDLILNQSEVYHNALNFLGLADDGRTNFSVKNATKTHRSKKVQYMLRMLLFARQKLPIRKFGIPVMNKLVTWNLRDESKTSIDADFRSELAEYFKADVGLLSSLMSRDFSHWLKNRRPQI